MRSVTLQPVQVLLVARLLPLHFLGEHGDVIKAGLDALQLTAHALKAAEGEDDEDRGRDKRKQEDPEA